MTSSCAISKARSTRFTFTFIVAQQRTGRQESCPKNIVRPFNDGELPAKTKTSKSVQCCGELWLSVVVHPLVLATAPQSRVPYRTNFLSGYVQSSLLLFNCYLLLLLFYQFHLTLYIQPSISLSTTCCSSSSCVNTWRTLLSIRFKSYVTRISIITALLQSASLTSGYL